MGRETALRIFNDGQPLNVVVSGRRFEGVMVTRLLLPCRIELLLRRRIGEPDKRIRVSIDDVELVQ